MKKIILFSLLILFCLPVITSAQTNKSTKDPVGKWIYEGPAAPEGYTSGKLEFSVADKKYSAIWTFIGNEENIGRYNIVQRGEGHWKVPGVSDRHRR